MSCETEAGLAIEVRSISKHFRLYDRQAHRLAELLSLSRKRYHRQFQALSDVSLTVRRGEAMGIIGRNGSGKSTLLQIICGTLMPSSGEVIAQGRVAALLELGAGFNPEFTGRENVYLNAALYGLSRAEIAERMDGILAFADIGDFVDQPVRTYSSGMFVRLAFAVIAHVDADILVIDEALAVGDVAFGQKCMRFLRSFREHGTILFVSHDTAAVTGLCDRAVWLDGGKKRADGSAKEVCELYLGDSFGDAKPLENAITEPDDTGSPTPGVHSERIVPPDDWIDQRRDWINGSALRNDLELFVFHPGASGDFGRGGAVIEDVRFTDSAGVPYRWIVGGEPVTLSIKVRARQELDRPIVGFFVKDRLGQNIFGDNTHLTTQIEGNSSVVAKPGDVLSTTFHFPMPSLPRGAYMIAVAVANGTQEEHVQHHWIHDALIFESHSSHTAGGLVGIPMLDISISVAEAAVEANGHASAQG